MEDLALKINSLSDLSFYESYPNWEYPNNKMTSAFSDIIHSTLSQINEIPIRRIYYGSEFCNKAIPNKNEILKIIDYCIINHLKLTFVLPPLFENTFSEINNLLFLFLEYRSLLDFEVSCNDLGTLYYLSNNYSVFKILRGRVLQKRIYDPRMDKSAFQRQLTSKSCNILEASSISNIELNLLRKLSVARIELDTYIDEFPSESISDYPCSVFLPFGLYTTGHICLMRNLCLSPEKKFDIGGLYCNQPCKKFYQTMGRKITDSESFITEDLFLFRSGNTIFYNNRIIGDTNLLAKYRIVLQPFPML